jgi:hypothetical protein
MCKLIGILNCLFIIDQIQSLREWKNHVASSQDTSMTGTLHTRTSVQESYTSVASSNMEATQQLIEVLEKAR